MARTQARLGRREPPTYSTTYAPQQQQQQQQQAAQGYSAQQGGFTQQGTGNAQSRFGAGVNKAGAIAQAVQGLAPDQQAKLSQIMAQVGGGFLYMESGSGLNKLNPPSQSARQISISAAVGAAIPYS